jgi:hypothetical protein
MDILKKSICFKALVLLLAALIFSKCSDRSDGQVPKEGFVEYEIEFITHADSDTYQQSKEFRNMFEGGVVEWHFSPEKEWTLQIYQVMGHPIELRERYNLKEKQRSTFVDYMGQLEEFDMNREEWEFAEEMTDQKTGFILIDDYSEFKGMRTRKFEGFIETEDYNAHLRGYIAIDLPMKASVIQGLEFNFLPGAVISAEVESEGLWTLRYNAKELSTDRKEEIWGFDGSDNQ